MYVKLDNTPDKQGGDHPRTEVWDEAFPFYFNPNGILVHRTRWVHDHFYYEKFSHETIGYWCGNLGQRGELLEFVPKEMILCARCESIAASNHLPTAEKLCGYHVHVGGIRAVRHCCQPNN